MNVPWNAATGAAIGADWLLAEIGPAGDFGRRVRATERAYRPGDEAAAEAALRRVESLARTVPESRLAALQAAIAAAPEPGAALASATGGGVLADADFFEIARLLDALADVATLARTSGLADDVLVTRIAADPALARLRTALAPGRGAERTFYLADGFSPELARERGAAAAAQERYDAVRSRLGARVARYAGLEHVRDGEFVLLRERFTAPLPPEIRVLREAPAYLLCELALDSAALAALSERDDTLAAVAEAEEAVRVRLTAHIGDAAPMLQRACDALGGLDLLVARARFTTRFRCTLPEIAATASAELDEARYLPLATVLPTRGRGYAPISFALEGVGVVTGPNMGGKTVALRTLGFAVACVALGVPVPAVRARLPLVDEIAWLGLGELPDRDGLLSAFGAEVVELRAFLERRPRRALVLVDEFARTTSPREGRALLVALVETLRSRDAFGFAATHFGGVSASAAAPHYSAGGGAALPHANGVALELKAALERIAAASEYRLVRVDEAAVPRADAFALAGALGLDAAFLARARAALAES